MTGDNGNGGQNKRAAIQAKFEADGIEVEWTAEELSVYLQRSRSSIYALAHARQIPHRRIQLPGRERPVFRFRKSEINKWRDQHSEVIPTVRWIRRGFKQMEHAVKTLEGRQQQDAPPPSLPRISRLCRPNQSRSPTPHCRRLPTPIRSSHRRRQAQSPTTPYLN